MSFPVVRVDREAYGRWIAETEGPLGGTAVYGATEEEAITSAMTAVGLKCRVYCVLYAPGSQVE